MPAPRRLAQFAFCALALALAPGCEQKPAPVVPRGILRCVPLDMPPDTAKDLGIPQGSPSRCLKIDYDGTKPWIEVTAVQWHKGEEGTSCLSLEPIQGPYSKEIAFGVRDHKDEKGHLVSQHLTLTGERKSEPGHTSLASRVAASTDAARAGITTLNGRKWRTLEPKWPLETAGDKEVVLWTVLVGGDPGDDARVSAEELVKRADDAWIFSVKLKDQQ